MNTIDKFYKAPSYRQPHTIEAKFKEYSDTFDIELVGSDQKPDCCIGHFGYNFYFRTPKGLKYKKYKSFTTLVNAIKRVAGNNNLTLESIGLKRGWKYRPIIKV